MDRQRVLELALNELQRQKAGIDEEIETLRNELAGTGAVIRQTRRVISAGRTGRKRTPAERKAQAQRMREYWAKKKAQAVKPAAIKKPAPASAKVRRKTDAQKKALSLKMREVWKKRKAAAAKKR